LSELLSSNPRFRVIDPSLFDIVRDSLATSVRLPREVVAQMQKSSLLRRGINSVLQGKRGGGAGAVELPSALLPRLYSCDTASRSRPIRRPESTRKLDSCVPLQPTFIPSSLRTKPSSRHCSSSASSTLLKIMADRDVLPDVYVFCATLCAATQ
jgi:hypothetical protein